MRGDLLIASVALGFSVLAARRWGLGLPGSTPPMTPSWTVPAAAAFPAEDSLDVLASTAAANDMFRLSRQPASTPYGMRNQAAPAPAPGIPALVLRGIIGGPPWRAVLDGLPGEPSGTLVSPGDSYERLTVRAVTRDSVFVQFGDTAFALSLAPMGSP